MKKEIASAPVLAYYNPKKQPTLQTDASVKGFGACLLQDDKPVYFASKAVTDALKGYVAIELELLAVAWPRRNVIISYMPVVFYLKLTRNHLKPYYLRVLIKQLQGYREYSLELLHYHFTVKYIPGSTNKLAEYLSHLGRQKDITKLPNCIFIKLQIN